MMLLMMMMIIMMMMMMMMMIDDHHDDHDCDHGKQVTRCYNIENKKQLPSMSLGFTPCAETSLGDHVALRAIADTEDVGPRTQRTQRAELQQKLGRAGLAEKTKGDGRG